MDSISYDLQSYFTKREISSKETLEHITHKQRIEKRISRTTNYVLP